MTLAFGPVGGMWGAASYAWSATSLPWGGTKNMGIVVYEYWQHRATGEVWAIKLNDGRVVGAAQIARNDVSAELLPYLAYRIDDVADFEKRRDDFTRIDGAGSRKKTPDNSG